MNGTRLRDLRTERRLTQAELAKTCGIGTRQILRYENNESEPTSSHLKKLAISLQVSSDYLLGLVNTYEDRYENRELTKKQEDLLRLLEIESVYAAFDVLDLANDHARETIEKVMESIKRG